MVDKTPGDRKLSVPNKTLTLKPRVETGTVKQSFSHGRTKQVVVEKRGKRRVGGDGPATETHAPEPAIVAKAAPAAPAAAGPDAASAAPTAATHNPRVSVPFMHGHPFPGPGRGSLHGQDRTPHAAAAHRTLP